jgi:DNA repair protein RadC
MPLNDLPHAERPREKLLAHGAAALSDAELLALLLRTGLKGKGVLELSRDLLAQFGSVRALLGASSNELNAIKGLGPAKYAELCAVLELAKRALAEELRAEPLLNSPNAVRDFLQLWLSSKPYEVFAVLFLDTKHRLIKAEEMARGTLSRAAVFPREIARRALELNAGAVILAHNHPSGDAEASFADQAVTRSIQAALELLEVTVLDHWVIGRGATTSFKLSGLL